MFNYVDEQEESFPPPQTPRSAKFTLSNSVKIAVLLTTLELFINILDLQMWWVYRHGPFAKRLNLSWIYMQITHLVFCYVFIQKELLNRRLFTNGIAVRATVTFVGKIREPFSIRAEDVVHWRYIVDGVEHTGVSPLDKLPHSRLGDVFWVLYKKENPNYVRRWESFDIYGNLIHDGDGNVEARAEKSRELRIWLPYILCFFVGLIAILIIYQKKQFEYIKSAYMN